MTRNVDDNDEPRITGVVNNDDLPLELVDESNPAEGRADAARVNAGDAVGRQEINDDGPPPGVNLDPFRDPRPSPDPSPSPTNSRFLGEEESLINNRGGREE